MVSIENATALNLLASDAHHNAVKHGFYNDIDTLMDICYKTDNPQGFKIAQRDFVLAQLSKIASEVGEAVSVIQHNEDYAGLSEELADITIRTMDLAAYLMYNHGDDVVKKMIKNESRPMKHGKLC